MPILKYKISLILLLFSFSVIAQDHFITTWKTDNTGTSGTTSITIPINSSYTYNYSVDWDNDGIMDETGLTGDVTHDFGTAGEYTIQITGTFPSIYFNNSGDSEKIIDVSQWGTGAWETMNSSLYGCANLSISATDAPDLSNVTSMESLFRDCTSLTIEDLTGWNVSNVENFSYMFRAATSFNGNVTNWNPSSATNIEDLFRNAKAFDQDISGWDVSNVTNMSGVMRNAESFDQNLVGWDVSMATDMSYMLFNVTLSTSNYDSTLISWATQTVQSGVSFHGGNSQYCDGFGARADLSGEGWIFTDGGMESSSCDTSSFITTWTTTASNTDVTIPTNSSDTYEYDVDWDNDGVFDEFNLTGDVTHDYGSAQTNTIRIRGTFPAIQFSNGGDNDLIDDVTQWGTQEWSTMYQAFYGCSNLSISATDAPDLSNVTTFASLFRDCTNLDAEDLTDWDVSTVENFSHCFRSSTFNGDISNWNMNSATSLQRMFRASSFNGDISNWEMPSNNNFIEIFRNASFNQDISGWDVSNARNFTGAFQSSSFDQNLGDWDISSVTNFTDMFTSSTLSTENYDATLTGWVNTAPSGITFGGGNSMYCSAADARQELIDTYGWTISDGGTICKETFMIEIEVEDDFTIPTNSSYTYDYDVDWDNDGVIDDYNVTGNITNTYGAAGTYTVVIYRTFPAIYFNEGNESEKIIDVQQWGTNIQWESFENAFSGCTNLEISAIDTPDLTNCTSFENIFYQAENFNSDISDWDVKTITNMSGAFYGAETFNQALNSWEVLNVIDMSAMFRDAKTFDQDISSWETGNVTDMSAMFRAAKKFNQDISSWETENVTDMSAMFREALKFNQDISGWTTNKVETMASMFSTATNFNQDISGWDVSLVTNTSSMFYNAYSFAFDISSWDVENVTNMSSMFLRALNFDCNLGTWDMSNVTNVSGMFANMSMGSYSYDSTLIGWSTQTLHTGLTFNGGSSTYCKGLSARETLENTYGWTISDGGEDCEEYYEDDAFVFIINRTGTDFTIPTNSNYTYDYQVDWDNDGTYDEFDLTGDVTHSYSGSGIDTISIWGTFPAIYFNNADDKDLITDVLQWGTQEWESFNAAFYGCSNLIISATDAPDLSNVTTFESTFRNCTSLSTEDLTSWDVSNVENFSYMFRAATSFNGNVTSWITSSAMNLEDLFRNASAFDQDISGWDVSNVTNMAGLMRNASAFDQNLVGWDVSLVTDMSYMFSDVTLSTSNYDNTLISWAAQTVQNGVTLHAGNSQYCDGLEARADLSGEGWEITDGGMESSSCDASFETNSFITTWTTRSINTDVTIPTNSSYTYKYDVDWDNDGIYDDLDVTGDITHDYGSAQTNVIRIRGTFPAIQFSNGGDMDLIDDVLQWGTQEWESFNAAFYGCLNLTIAATDTPDLSNVTTFESAFRDCESLSNEDLTSWDVSTVENFSYMFRGATNFNGNVMSWTTSSAMNLEDLFRNTESFDQDISGWDVSNVTNMAGVMRSSQSFDQNLGDWDVSMVTDMSNMFLNIALSTSNYDSTLIGWRNTAPSGITFDGGSSTYCISQSSRDYLTDNLGWTISDEGLDVSCDEISYLVATFEPSNSGTSTSIYLGVNTSTGFDIDWDNDGIYDEFGVTESLTHDFGSTTTQTIRITGDFDGFNYQSGNQLKDLVSIEQWGSSTPSTYENAFSGCENLVINATDTPDFSNATTVEGMFSGCDNLAGNFENWDLTGITTTSQMFNACRNFNEDISSWNVEGITDMSQMFSSCFDFNSDLSGWNVEDVEYVSEMFTYCDDFNGDLSGWNLANATDMTQMFYYCTSFDRDITGWNFESAETMSEMFYGASSFNQDISNWNVSTVSNMSSMFGEAYGFDQNLGDWDISAVTDMEYMFYDVTLSTSNYDSTLIGWASQTVQSGVTFYGGNSQYCEGIEERLVLTSDNSWNITDGGLGCTTEILKISVVTNNSGGSEDTEFSIPVNSDYSYNYHVDWESDGIIDDYNVTEDITHTYSSEGTYNISIYGTYPAFGFGDGDDPKKIIDITQWGTGEWKSFEEAFTDCENLAITATDAPDLTNCISMKEAFSDATYFNSSINHWDVSKIEDMSYMFNECGNFNQSLNDWDVSSVQNMRYMFNECVNFNQSLNDWNVSIVEDMAGMFYDCTEFDVSLNDWDVSSVQDMSYMFKNATSFDQGLSSWNISNITDMKAMFNGVTLSTVNYDSTLIGWASQTVQSGVTFHGGNSNYCNGEDARNTLTSDNSWTITDGGEDCDYFTHFVTTWQTDKSGTSEDTEITIPTNSSYTYNYDVDWDNDGFFDEFGLTGDVTHDFGTAGTYTIRIQGTFPTIYFDSKNDVYKIIDIAQWGDNEWETMEKSFYGCKNMEMSATDTPDFSNVTDMSYMFRHASYFNGDVSEWDVSNVTTMNVMFSYCSSFEGNGIGNWDVSSVEHMGNMFRSATVFDQDLSEWDVSNVTNINNMFIDITLSTFNYDRLLIAWNELDLSTGESFNGGNSQYCFAEDAWNSLQNTHGWSISDGGNGCGTAYDYFVIEVNTNNSGLSEDTEFTLPINSALTYNYDVDWDNDGVFDQTGLTEADGDITHDFETSGSYLITIQGTFPTIYFNNGGDKDKITDVAIWGDNEWESLASSFYGCSNLNITALDTIELTNCTSLENTFREAISLNSDLSEWDVSSVENMSQMFEGATNFNQNLGEWDVSSVENMSQMFNGATNFNQNLGDWNVSSVENMSQMFSDVSNFDQNLGDWDVSNVIDFSSMFSNVSSLSSTNYDNLLIGWNRQNLSTSKSTDMGTTAYCAASVANVNLQDASVHNWSISDGGQGDIFIDSSLTRGYMLTLDGTNDYVSMGHTTVSNFIKTEAFSGEAWMNVNSIGTDQHILGKFSGDATTPQGWSLMLLENSGNPTLAFQMSGGTTTDQLISVPTTIPTLNTGEWYHVAFVYDGSNVGAGITFYINGVSYAGEESASSPATNVVGSIQNDSSFTIGGNANGEELFNGSIDEVRLWLDERTTSEIRENMHIAMELSCTDESAGYWQFNLSDGTTATDYSSFGNDGTHVGNPSIVESEVSAGYAWSTSHNAIATNTVYSSNSLETDVSLDLNFTTAAPGDDLVVTYVDGLPVGGAPVTSLENTPTGYWVVDNYGTNSGLGAEAIFHFADGTITNEDLESHYLHKRGSMETGSWTQNNSSAVATSSTAGSNYTKFDNIDGFSMLFSSFSSSILPVTWLSFDLNYTEENINVAWSTVTETNNQEFVIERLDDGEWKEIGNVEGNNTSLVNNYYAYADSEYMTGQTIYYRIKQIDIDGDYTYSDVKSIYVNNANSLSVYPNPSNGNFTIDFLQEVQQGNVKVIDVNGQMILTQKIEYLKELKISFDNLKEGIYFIEAYLNNQQYHTKIIVKK